MKILRYIKQIYRDLVGSVIIGMPGPTGRKMRYWYYKNKFKKCGRNVVIDEGVIIQNPEWISIGNNVWIDRYCVLIAGRVNYRNDSIIKEISNKDYLFAEGELIIGSNVHIGINNIIQSHVGVVLGDNSTTSAGVKIYSLSNSCSSEIDKSTVTYANSTGSGKVAYVKSPVVIKAGVWVALNVCVLGGTIGENSFVKSNSVVYKSIPENSIASGSPAKKISNRFGEK